MGEHLAERLIDLRGFGSTAKGIPELGLDHVERRFDVAALVVALHEACADQ